MNSELPTLQVRGRKATQERSTETKHKIVGAAMEVIASVGVAGLTHRLVAEQAGVSLAATTYYYQAKSDIISDVSNMLLSSYEASIRSVVAKSNFAPQPASSFRDLVIRVLCRAAGAKRAESMVWMELMLNAGRDPENIQYGRIWAARLQALWADIANKYEIATPDDTARSAIDLVIGMQLAILALQLDEAQIRAVLTGTADPLEIWRFDEPEAHQSPSTDPGRSTPKSRATRRRIIDATMRIIAEQGVGAVSYRAVAQSAGLTPAAPPYYFSTPAELLRAAQDKLFDDAKSRYREAMFGVDHSALNLPHLVDLTTTVFQREAIENGGFNLASYGIWLEAARQAALRPKVWSAIEDQGRGWVRVMGSLQPGLAPRAALVAQFLFIGKLIRIVCLGAATPDLAQVRKELFSEFKALTTQTHWLDKNGTKRQKNRLQRGQTLSLAQ